MKIRVLIFLLVISVIVAATLSVHWNDEPPDRVVLKPVEVTPKHVQTAQNGLKFLVEHQFEDGHWEGDNGEHPVAMTGLAGLALLMERTWNTDGRGSPEYTTALYKPNILKAANWLVAQSRPGRDGLIFSEHPSETDRYMEGHGLATLFLAGVLNDAQFVLRRKDRSDDVTNAVTNSVKQILKSQNTRGGWYHTAKAEGHDLDAILPTVIQLQALMAARKVGIHVPRRATQHGTEFLMKEAKQIQNLSRSDTASILAWFSAGYRGHAVNTLWGPLIEHCETKVSMRRNSKLGQDEIVHYFFAQAMYTEGEKKWDDYRIPLFDLLHTEQDKDGGWRSGNGISVGRVYSTAVWCTILQLHKRSHPLSNQIILTIQ